MASQHAMRSPRLRRLARPEAEDGAASGRPGNERPMPERRAEEECDLCSAPLPADHRHLLDTSERRLLCCCQACKVLFDRRAAGGGHFRLIPNRRLRIEDFRLDEPAWESLAIPVEMAFFFRNSELGRVVAFYPSPMGATESQLELTAWTSLERDNPILADMEEDVEALLVNRARGAREHWLVPIDDCYGLVGLMRTRWKGLSGGQEVWEALRRFFERLAAQGKVVDRTGAAKTATEPATALAGADKEATWQK